jgi:hypothetical protein
MPPDNPDTIARKGNSTQAPNLIYRRWVSTEVEALEKEVLRENLRIHTDNGRLPVTKTDGQLLKDITQLNWETIAFAIPGRTANECKIQWTVNKHPFINELPFKKQEVAKLKHVINKYGARDWIKIAREHGVRFFLQSFDIDRMGESLHNVLEHTFPKLIRRTSVKLGQSMKIKNYSLLSSI